KSSSTRAGPSPILRGCCLRAWRARRWSCCLACVAAARAACCRSSIRAWDTSDDCNLRAATHLPRGKTKSPARSGAFALLVCALLLGRFRLGGVRRFRVLRRVLRLRILGGGFVRLLLGLGVLVGLGLGSLLFLRLGLGVLVRLGLGRFLFLGLGLGVL